VEYKTQIMLGWTAGVYNVFYDTLKSGEWVIHSVRLLTAINKNNCQKRTIKVKSNPCLMFGLKSFRELLSRKF
jgi:hypothetical protein